MTSCTEASLRAVIATHGGVLLPGSHVESDENCCLLEAKSLCLGLPMTDDPDAVGLPDLRPLNDARWSSDALRTEQMIRLAVALEPWAGWTEWQRQQWVGAVALGLVRRIVAELPALPDKVRAACRTVTTRAGAASAAWAAERAAASAAASAEHPDAVLLIACDVWIAAIEAVTPEPA